MSRYRKYNEYNLEGLFGIGYTLKGEEFYFDLEDYDRIKYFCWYIVKHGYVKAYDNDKKKIVAFHRLVMRVSNNNNKEIDHINRKRKDNRKENLRKTSRQQNSMNRSLQKNNKTGVIGIREVSGIRKWKVTIDSNRKKIHLGYYTDFEEAVKIRLIAEKKILWRILPTETLI